MHNAFSHFPLFQLIKQGRFRFVPSHFEGEDVQQTSSQIVCKKGLLITDILACVFTQVWQILFQAVKPQEGMIYTLLPCTGPALVIPDSYGAQLAPINGFF